MPIPFIGWVFLVLIGIVIPWAAILTARKLDEGTPWMSRGMFFAQIYISQLLLLGVALATAHFGQLELPRDTERTGTDLLVGALALGALAGSLPWRFAHMRTDRRERIAQILPQTRRELALFGGVSLLAGVGEEIVYRGVLFVLLERLIGDAWWAALASAALFGLSHAAQGWISSLTIAGFALIFHGIVALTGGLWVAMLVHVLYDAFAGYWCGSWREGDPVATTPGTVSALPVVGEDPGPEVASTGELDPPAPGPEEGDPPAPRPSSGGPLGPPEAPAL